jgi:hypothetical protein
VPTRKPDLHARWVAVLTYNTYVGYAVSKRHGWNFSIFSFEIEEEGFMEKV